MFSLRVSLSFAVAPQPSKASKKKNDEEAVRERRELLGESDSDDEYFQNPSLDREGEQEEEGALACGMAVFPGGVKCWRCPFPVVMLVSLGHLFSLPFLLMYGILTVT